MKKSKVIGRRGGGVSPLAFGTLFSFISLTVTSFVVSLIISSLKNPIEVIAVGSLIAFMASGAISGFSIAKKNRGIGFRLSLLCSVIFIAIVLICSLILGKGSLSGGNFMNYLCYLMISAFFAFLGAREKRRRGRR